MVPAPAARALFGWPYGGATPGPNPTDPCTSKTLIRRRPREEEQEDSNSEEEWIDVVSLLDEAEALELWSLIQL